MRLRGHDFREAFHMRFGGHDFREAFRMRFGLALR